MIMRVIIWGGLIWVAPLMYFVLANETKFKKNIAVGVTLPWEGRADREVTALLARFRRRLGAVCLAMTVLGIVGLLLPVSTGATLALAFVWIDLCIVLPHVPYVRCNRALKRLKQARGWRLTCAGTAVADLSAAAQPDRELSVLCFLPPLIVGLIPPAFEWAAGERLTGAFLLAGPICVILFYVLYRWAYRRKAELVDDNTDLTAVLTRLRRQYWRRFWLWGAWCMGLVNLSVGLCLHHAVAGLAALMILAAALLMAALGLEFRLRAAQERLTRDSGRGFYVDTDDKWLWGIFYCDPNDRRLIINDRVGVGSSVNLARRGGRVIMGATAALMLCLPLIGVWVMQEERSPVMLEVTETALVASHGGTAYEIPLDEVRELRLLEELPALTRVAGTAMETVCKGTFRCAEYGNVTLCLAPGTGPWLLVVTEAGRTYLLGASVGMEAVRQVLSG